MTRNSTLSRVLAVILTLLLLLTALFGLSELVKRKSSYIQYADFFDEEQNFDVLFLGTSHMLDAVYPMELWKDHGFLSYNFGGNANALATTYWAAQMALEYTTPSVLVVDCFDITEEAKTSRNSFSYVHLSLDAFPISRTKIRAVQDLLHDEEVERLIAEEKLINEANVALIGQEEERDPITLLWPFSVYHNRWSSLGRSDFRPPRNVQKGAETMVGVYKPAEMKQVPANEKLERDTVSIAYLERLITDCQARGIEVLLTYLPFTADETEQLEAHRLYDIAEKYGVDYLNFLDLNVVDEQTDCFDHSHLNCSGAEKVTAYLGDYLTSHYELPDHRDDPAYASWYEDYERYRAFQHSLLQEQDQFARYLMLLANDSYTFELSLGDNRVFTVPMYRNLLQNIGIDADHPIVPLNDADLEIRVYDRDTGAEVDAIRGNFVMNTAGELTGVSIYHL
ncbi:MAG: hypothetical protein IJV40_06775 [Oscillospiraceae bacterium]|nr:hypothetical protein [Oscillospiraceae bacterium]